MLPITIIGCGYVGIRLARQIRQEAPSLLGVVRRQESVRQLQDLGISDRLPLPPLGDADEFWGDPSPPPRPEPPAPSWTTGLLRSLRRD